MRIVIYGPHGVGKTTFMAEAEGAVIIPAETGAEGFHVARLDKPHPPRTFEEILQRVRWLQTAPHDFKTLGIDTGDMVEQFAYQLAITKYNRRDTSKNGPADNIEEVGGGYKKGYVAAAAEWIRLLDELERLRERRGMHIVVSCHARIVKFMNPKGDDYDKYTLKLHQDAGLGLVQEWADAVLFANFDTRAVKKGKRGRAKGEGGKQRVLYTENDAAWDAKNRYDLPARLPLDWGVFYGHVQGNKSVKLLDAAIDAAVAELTAAGVQVEIKGTSYPIADIVISERKRNPSPKHLARLKNRLEARIELLEEQRLEQEEQAQRAEGAAG